jgi:hypothetical protein
MTYAMDGNFATYTNEIAGLIEDFTSKLRSER